MPILVLEGFTDPRACLAPILIAQPHLVSVWGRGGKVMKAFREGRYATKNHSVRAPSSWLSLLLDK